MAVNTTGVPKATGDGGAVVNVTVVATAWRAPVGPAWGGPITSFSSGGPIIDNATPPTTTTTTTPNHNHANRLFLRTLRLPLPRQNTGDHGDEPRSVAQRPNPLPGPPPATHHHQTPAVRVRPHLPNGVRADVPSYRRVETVLI
jgi:hypothetical protein